MYANEKDELKKKIPENLPTQFGNGFCMCVLVDSDHAGDQVTRRHRIGILVFINNALI